MPRSRAEDNPAPRPPDEGEGGSTRPLTERELEILTHVARGQTNRQIGTELGISPLTVRNHLRTIQRKLATTDRTQAVVLAIGNGWIPIEIVLHAEDAAAPAIPGKPAPESKTET